MRHWTTEDRLPQNRIACLKQTRDGYLWIGTWAGLVRFDGVHFTPFNKFNTPELVNDAINTLAQDAGGRVWIGTHDGLLSYWGYRFQRFTMADGLPDRNFVQSVNSSSRGLWLQVGHSVLRLDHEKFSDSRLLELTRANHILSMRERDDGSLDIITSRAWLTLSPSTRELRTNYAVAAQDDDWAAALSASDGSVWVGTGLGLQRLAEGGLRSFPTNGLGEGVVDFVHEDGGSNLWVNVRKDGLYRWDHAGWARVNLGEGRSSIVCMEEDFERNLWVGTDCGLVHLQRQPVRAYTTRDGLADDNVLSVCEDTKGTIWAGTDHGLSCIREGGVSDLSTNEPIPEVRDLAVWPRHDVGVWYGKAGQGVFVCQGTKFSKVLVGLTDACGALNALYGDRSGRLWVGRQHGALAFQEGQFDNPCQILKSPCDVRCIHEDREGAFWFGTMKEGLLRQRDGNIASFTERDGLSNNSVWSIVEDSDGTLWIGTDNGLTRYHNGKFFPFRKQHGLPENNVNCVLYDDFDCLWVKRDAWGSSSAT